MQVWWYRSSTVNISVSDQIIVYDWALQPETIQVTEDATVDVRVTVPVEFANLPLWTQGAHLVGPDTPYAVFDSFSEGSNTNLTSHSPEIAVPGGGWTAALGTWTVLSADNTLQPPENGEAYIEAGLSDLVVKARISPVTGNVESGGIIFRVADDENLLRAAIAYGTQTLQFAQRVNDATFDIVTTSVTLVEDEWYTITVIAKGDKVVAYLDDQAFVVAQYTNHQTETKVGFANYNNRCRYDQLEVYPIPYILRATFEAPEQAMIHGQTLRDSVYGVDKGSLDLVINEGSFHIVNNSLRFHNDAPSTWDSSGFYQSSGIHRTLGRGLYFDMYAERNADHMFGWGKTAALSYAQDGYTFRYRVSGAELQVRANGALVTAIADLPLFEDMNFLLVLGGYDSNGNPWRAGEARSSYGYGCAYFAKGDSWSSWTLVWRETGYNDTPLYPKYNNYDQKGTLSKVEVPDVDLSYLLQPIVFDSFTDDDSTSLDAHTPELDTSGNGWTEGLGDWQITSNEATGGSVAYVQTSHSDVLADVRCRMGNTQGAGVSFRYSDSDHYWFVQASDGADAIQIYERNGSNIFRASTAVSLSSDVNYEVRAFVDGSTIEAWVNSGSRVTYGSATMNQSQTNHGLRNSASNCYSLRYSLFRRNSYKVL